MIKINFKDGTTFDLDLFNDEELNNYKNKLKNPFFIKNITGMSIYQNNQLITIQKPVNFNSLSWECSKVAEASFSSGDNFIKSKNVGECISLIINDKIKTNLIYYFSNKMIKSFIQFIDS